MIDNFAAFDRKKDDLGRFQWRLKISFDIC